MSAHEAAGRPAPGRTRTMNAIVQDTYGSPDVLELREVAVPTIKDDEVLVRVRASSVNAADWHFMRGKPYFMRLIFGTRAPSLPIRGVDVAGEVEAVGAAVTTVQVGDAVYGEAGTGRFPAGGFAEYAVVHQNRVAVKPANLAFEQAAAVPLAANTALQGLRDVGEVRAGHKVLINGASGGVGTFAVQLAKSFGAEVTAVCSTRNVDLVRTLGADHVLDYTRDDFTQGGERYDVIFDLVSNRSLSHLRRALTPTGTLVLSGGGGGPVLGPLPTIARASLLSPVVTQRLRPLSAAAKRENLLLLTQLIESAAVTPAIDRVYPLSEAADAMRYVEDEHARAKVVLVV